MTAPGGVDVDHARATLAVAFGWLYDTSQPDTAVCEPHPKFVASYGAGQVTVMLAPAGHSRFPVLVVDHDVRFPTAADRRWWLRLVNTVGDRWSTRAVSSWNWDRVPERHVLGAPLDPISVTRRDNGSLIGHAGSVRLARPAHPTLRAAVERHATGCPTHPDAGVSCRCGWLQHGKSALIVADYTTIPKG